jgi:hypothetical protein
MSTTPGLDVQSGVAAETSSAVLQEELGALLSEQELSTAMTGVETRLLSLRAELKEAELHGAQPIDSPQWGTAGAPEGALGKLRFDEGRGNVLATSPDGKSLLTCTAANQMKLLDAVTGEVKLTFGNHGGFITDAAWSPDGTKVATTSYDRTGRIFDATTGALLASIPLDGKLGVGAGFSHNGEIVRFGEDSMRTLLVNTKTFQIVGECPAEYPDKMAFTQDDTKVWYTDDQTLKMKDLKTQEIKTFSPGIGSIYAMDVSKDDKLVGLGSVGGTVVLMDAESGKVLTKMNGNGSAVFSIAFTSDEMIVGYQSGKITVFDVKNIVAGKALSVVKEYQVGGMAHIIDVSTSGKTFIVQVIYGGQPKGIDIVSFSTGAQTQTQGRTAEAIQADITALGQEEGRLTGIHDERETLIQALAEAQVRESQALASAATEAAEREALAQQLAAQEAARIATEEMMRSNANEIGNVLASSSETEMIATEAKEATVATEEELMTQTQTLKQQEAEEELRKRGQAWLSGGPATDGTMRTEVRVTSPYDQTYLKTPLGVMKFEHPGGAQDLVVFRRFFSEGGTMDWEGSKVRPQGEFALYADEACSVMLDRIVFEGDRANRSVAVITEQRTEAKEWLAEPSVQVLAAERANVTVAVQSPFETGVAELTGGGFLGTKEITGTDFQIVTLTMDGTKPSGTYEVQLLDRPNGTIVGRIPVEWDQTKKTLSVVGGLKSFTPQISANTKVGFAEALSQYELVVQAISQKEVMSQVSGEILVESRLDGSAADALASTQLVNLTALAAQSGYALTVDKDGLWERFISVFPEWKEENKAATTKQMNLSGDNFYYYREAEFNGYAQYMDAYNDAVGRMLEAGMNAITTARAGGDPTAYLTALNAVPGKYGSNVWAKLAVMGVKLPERPEILAACEAILEQKAQELVQSQVAAANVVETQMIQFNTQMIGGTGEASSPTQVISAARQAFISQLYAAQSVLPMYGEDGTTIIGYGGTVGVNLAGESLYASAPAQETGSLVASLVNLKSLGVLSAIDIHQLKLTNGILEGAETVRPLRNGVATITFELKETSMVNFWVDTGELGTLTTVPSQGLIQPDIALALGGTGLNGEYDSNKEGDPSAGESISSVLPAGTYTLLVRDVTDYQGQESLHLSDVLVGINIRPYTTQKIEGRISIEGRDVTMPVSMSVAEFDKLPDGSWERMKASETHALDPSKPVWVVIHGRTNSENSDNIVDLTKALYEFDQAHKGAYQVVTINWELASKDNSFLPLNFDPLRDATWTPAVGKWVAHQLEALGFEGKNINLIGSSHGAFASYFAAQEFNQAGKGIVHSIIALDPAANVQFFNGSDPIDESKIKFSEVAETSLAIKAQVDEDLIHQNILDATDAGGKAYQTSQLFEYGSDERAKTAHFALELEVPKEISRDRIHPYPITAFAAIIRESIRQGGTGKIANSPVGLQHILATMQGLQTMNPDRQFDGAISAQGYRDEVKADWWKALPTYLDLRYGEDIPLTQ